LFIIFNRPRQTELVFEAIRKAKPLKLLVVADGPRSNRPGEKDACDATRAIIETVDWPCQVLKNYSEHNMGCKKRVSTGINWGFSEEEELIVLEDDCLPSDSFFSFANECLDRYRHEHDVGLISGTNLVPDKFLPRKDSSYRFSKYPHIWGWASWRRAWGNYSVEINDLPPNLRQFKQQFPCSIRNHDYWFNIFNAVSQGKIDTWDYQLFYYFWKNKLISISPNVNLIENIGFGQDATHTFGDRPSWLQPARELTWPILHPKNLTPYDRADIWESKKLFSNPVFFRRLLSAIRRRMRKIL